jgi:hypothetical protein
MGPLIGAIWVKVSMSRQVLAAQCADIFVCIAPPAD